MAKVYIEGNYNIEGVFDVPDKIIDSKSFDEWLFDRISNNQLVKKYSENFSEEFQLKALDRRPPVVV